ncbi:MAG TPA: hypothetical protein VL049_25130 [Candidatus Dormibacteraeota bacterium]|nr:hypothetical protein [Candidatus Dormibacteraeota bacterium]
MPYGLLGVPDDVLGQKGWACVVPSDAADPRPSTSCASGSAAGSPAQTP